jgi:hypothetical protein
MYSLRSFIWAIKIKEDEMGRPCGMYWEEEKCMQGFCGENEGTRPLQKSEYRWENDIKMDLKEIGWDNVDWMNLALG